MTHPPGCKCHPDSPFLWAFRLRESFAMSDATMRVKGQAGLTKSQLATRAIQRQQYAGTTVGTIRGIGRDREAEMTRLRDFKAYSLARTKSRKENTGASAKEKHLHRP